MYVPVCRDTSGREASACWRRKASPAIPENREFKKWKFSFFPQRHTLSMSFDIFVLIYTVTNFLLKLIEMLLFSVEKTEFQFFVFPYFPVLPFQYQQGQLECISWVLETYIRGRKLTHLSKSLTQLNIESADQDVQQSNTVPDVALSVGLLCTRNSPPPTQHILCRRGSRILVRGAQQSFDPKGGPETKICSK